MFSSGGAFYGVCFAVVLYMFHNLVCYIFLKKTKINSIPRGFFKTGFLVCLLLMQKCNKITCFKHLIQRCIGVEIHLIPKQHPIGFVLINKLNIISYI